MKKKNETHRWLVQYYSLYTEYIIRVFYWNVHVLLITKPFKILRCQAVDKQLIKPFVMFTVGSYKYPKRLRF